MKCPRSDILEFLQGVLLISFPVPLYAFHLSLYSGKGIAQFVLQVLIRIQLHPVQIAHRTTRIFTLREVNLISFQNVFQCSGICFFFFYSQRRASYYGDVFIPNKDLVDDHIETVYAKQSKSKVSWCFYWHSTQSHVTNLFYLAVTGFFFRGTHLKILLHQNWSIPLYKASTDRNNNTQLVLHDVFMRLMFKCCFYRIVIIDAEIHTGEQPTTMAESQLNWVKLDLR